HIAYWYPQMAVYDDVERWQADPFLGNAEFYLGFGRYDVTIEVPEGWVVMATGQPQNLQDVLAPAILERYRRAIESDTVVHVLTEADFGPGVATVRSQAEDGYLRWHFVSDTVRDVAFAAMLRSQWDATRTAVGDRDGDGVTDYATINTFWRSSAPRWAKQWRYAQHSIAFLSEWTGLPYPWPHMTSIEGGGIESGGMEYPMMTLIGPYDWPQATDTSLYGVTAHELAHMWFPMIVGTDERRYSWMD
ncbi:MAG: M1 family peptidase, partial [Gemmatimonadales bacterium]|nr:M1 family peptidase [Gemmatimonadales bacterium]